MVRSTLFSAMVLAGAIALLPAPAAAQGHAEAARLHLSATGEVSVTPDQATVSAGVVTRGDSAEEALRENATRMNAVFNALAQAGVDAADLQTRSLTVSPIYESRRTGSYGDERPRILGYEARNTVVAQVREIDTIGTVIDASFAAGANSLDGVQFSSSETEAARNEARRRAVTELMELRDLYAQAAGFEVTGLVNFSENSGAGPVVNARFESAAMAVAATPVAAGELTVSVTVVASWEIEG